MVKRIVSLILFAFCVGLAGCASPIQNIGAGALAGGAFGAAVGDNRKAAVRGAVIGGVLGAFVPTQQQQVYTNGVGNYTAPIAGNGGLPPGYSCPPGSAWDGRGCRTGINQSYNQGYPQQPLIGNQQMPAGAVCGAAAFRLPCPSISIPGTNCRRCQ